MDRSHPNYKFLPPRESLPVKVLTEEEQLICAKREKEIDDNRVDWDKSDIRHRTLGCIKYHENHFIEGEIRRTKMNAEKQELIEDTRQKFIESANLTKTRRTKICYDPSVKPYRFYYIDAGVYKWECNFEIFSILGAENQYTDNPKQLIEQDLSIAVFGEPNKLEAVAVAVENIMAGEVNEEDAEKDENEEKYGFKVFGRKPDWAIDEDEETFLGKMNENQLKLLQWFINSHGEFNLIREELLEKIQQELKNRA